MFRFTRRRLSILATTALAATSFGLLSSPPAPASPGPASPGAVPAPAVTSGPDKVLAALNNDTALRIPNTYWSRGADGTVTMSYSTSLAPAAKGRLTAAAKRLGPGVRLQPFAGTLSSTAESMGGYGIRTGSAGCTLGFNTLKNGVYHFLTAGHCTENSTNWYLSGDRGGAFLGTTAGTVFGPTGDFGVVRYSPAASAIAKYGTVFQYSASYQDIQTSGWPAQGSTVCHSGITTGKRCGVVRATCATVTYQDGTRVGCLTQVSACIDRGDSGGPLWRGTVALGIASGGVVGCRVNPTGPSFYTPVQRALTYYGLKVF